MLLPHGSKLHIPPTNFHLPRVIHKSLSLNKKTLENFMEKSQENGLLLLAKKWPDRQSKVMQKTRERYEMGLNDSPKIPGRRGHQTLGTKHTQDQPPMPIKLTIELCALSSPWIIIQHRKSRDANMRIFFLLFCISKNCKVTYCKLFVKKTECKWNEDTVIFAEIPLLKA